MSFLNSYLEWDSNFFSLRIAKGNAVDIDSQFRCEIEEFFLENVIDLLYFESEDVITGFSHSELVDCEFVDLKTIYEKNLSTTFPECSFIKGIDEINLTLHKKQIMSLAVQSAEYSRFKIDHRFKDSDYIRLYEEWISKSISKLLAHEVLFYEVEGSIAGLVTLGGNQPIGQIGIIAVDDKFRGQGIAKKLMHAAENWFIKNQYNKINVVTQGTNLPACSLYSACGYKILNTKYFYHIWRK